MLAEMQAMHAELNALRQAPELGAAANGPIPVAPSGVATGGGEPVVAPQRPLELRDWCGMSLEKLLLLVFLLRQQIGYLQLLTS